MVYIVGIMLTLEKGTYIHGITFGPILN
jgi:hypothetical protein